MSFAVRCHKNLGFECQWAHPIPINGNVNICLKYVENPAHDEIAKSCGSMNVENFVGLG